MKATMSDQLPNGPERELLAAVERKLKAEPELQYHEALKLVGHENPGLARRHLDKQRDQISGRLDRPESVLLSECPRFIASLGRVRLSDTDQSSRVPLAMIGTFYKGKQRFSITRADVQLMADNFAKRGTGDVAMDYEHASERPETAQGQPIPAAGWIVGINPEPDADGIVWGAVRFTPRARKMIAAGEYKYVSPVIDWGTRDRASGQVQGATLTSAALTNRPVLDRMPAIQLSDAGWAMA
jgi:hypothetical protein